MCNCENGSGQDCDKGLERLSRVLPAEPLVEEGVREVGVVLHLAVSAGHVAAVAGPN